MLHGDILTRDVSLTMRLIKMTRIFECLIFISTYCLYMLTTGLYTHFMIILTRILNIKYLYVHYWQYCMVYLSPISYCE